MNEEVTIRVRNDGPLVVSGPVRILDSLGNQLQPPGDKPNIALCRCGQSNSKPFCDGSHRAQAPGKTD
jgi:CDGSH-type Zn-finger protein